LVNIIKAILKVKQEIYTEKIVRLKNTTKFPLPFSLKFRTIIHPTNQSKTQINTGDSNHEEIPPNNPIPHFTNHPITQLPNRSH
jgi:hypothetical protein